MSNEKYLKIKKHLEVKQAMEAMINKEYNKAIDIYSSLLVSDSNDWKLYINRCNCYQRLNLFSEALEDAETAIGLNPNQLSVHYRRGCALLGLNRFRKAEEAFRTALSCDPFDENTHNKVRETLEQFIKEFGFKDTKDIQIILNRYKTCAEISDAMISGDIIPLLDTTSASGDKTVVSSESIGESFELTQSFNQMNVSQSVASISTYDSSFDSNSSYISITVDHSEGIRKPKCAPIFKKSSITPINSPFDGQTSRQDDSQSIISYTSDESLQSTPTSKPKMVKTRPQIMRVIKT